MQLLTYDFLAEKNGALKLEAVQMYECFASFLCMKSAIKTLAPSRIRSFLIALKKITRKHC